MLICLDQRSGQGCGASHPDGTSVCPCGRALQFALRLLNPGDLVGRYRIRHVVGHGSFGAVYAADDTAAGGPSVALKETFDPASIQSFQGEFAVLRGLQHPNLPQYHELFEANGSGYLVMEYVPGQSLEAILQKRQGPLLESQVLGYAIQLCDVLRYLHQRMPPILHRDIKPANIRLTPEGLIKLVDFGLLKQGVGATRSSRLGLTPAYAPIEQYGGRGGATDPRTDIYSLGATLYHLVTGQEPLPATDRVAVTPDPLPAPQAVNPQLAAPVADAIRTALALFQKDRFASAVQFKQALLRSHTSPAAVDATIRIAAPATARTCAQCGAVQASDEIYCQQCAQPIQPLQPCRRCRKPTPANARFCPNCGRQP